MRAQQSFEMLVIMSLVMFLTLGVLLFMMQQSSSYQRSVDSEILGGIADNFHQEIRNIMRSPTDIKRNITLTSYPVQNLRIEQGTTLVLEGQGQYYIEFLRSYVHGQPCIGENLLVRRGPFIGVCCDCDDLENINFGLDLTTEQGIRCYANDFDWRSCDSFESGTIIKGFTAHCPGESQAVFEVDGIEYIAVSSYDDWIYVTNIEHTVNADLSITVDCGGNINLGSTIISEIVEYQWDNTGFLSTAFSYTLPTDIGTPEKIILEYEVIDSAWGTGVEEFYFEVTGLGSSIRWTPQSNLDYNRDKIHMSGSDLIVDIEYSVNGVSNIFYNQAYFSIATNITDFAGKTVSLIGSGSSDPGFSANMTFNITISVIQ